MCFYGLSFNSGKQDLFKGTGLMAGVEVLAYFIILFTIDIGGRRPGNFPDIFKSVRPVKYAQSLSLNRSLLSQVQMWYFMHFLKHHLRPLKGIWHPNGYSAKPVCLRSLSSVIDFTSLDRRILKYFDLFS